MAKSLWGFYDGEPFMENPHLVVLNPRRRYVSGRGEELDSLIKRKGRKKMARKSSRAHMAYVRSFRKNAPKRRKAGRKAAPKRKKKLHYGGRIAKNKYRYVRNPRRRARRNAFPVAGLLANPRRRRFTSRGNMNELQIMGFRLPAIKTIAYATAGFMGTPMLEAFVNKYLPASITGTAWGRYGVKIASVIAISFIAKKTLGPEPAKVIAVGGSTYVLVSAVNEFLVPKVTGVSAYARSGMRGYSPTGTGLGSYGQIGLLNSGLGSSQPSSPISAFSKVRGARYAYK